MANKAKKLNTPGTVEWFRGEAVKGPGCILDSILRLYEQGEITRGKVRDMIESMNPYVPYDVPKTLLDAPWEKFHWGPVDVRIPEDTERIEGGVGKE